VSIVSARPVAGHPLVVVDRLTKRYARLTALAEASFTIRSGEVLGLIGPNGSGKTTLFECLAGVRPADAGAVSVAGVRLEPRERAAHLFFLPDAIAPWPTATVGWALDFALGYFGGPVGERHAVIDRLGLAPLMSSRIGTLSKGQRKRALLAVGMLTPHPILLVDEPFDGLDLRQCRDVGAALRTHAAAGRTLFLSIHQMSDAARVCDRFVLLSGGTVRGEGTLAELALAARQPSADSQPNLEDVVLALT
jgi:ABC-type multidrug transport system ATPase subunit